jgi:hypothetical protein
MKYEYDENFPTRTIKRLRILQYLVSKGFTKYEIIPDPTSNKGYNWFVFKNTPELQEALNDYFQEFNKLSK